jgi:pyruvate-formate lyase-activating enzyme
MDTMNKFIEIKQQLNQRSEFFCPAKWTELFLYLNHGNSNSCHHPIPHAIPADLLSDPYVLHNTPHKLEMQQLMMQGHRPQECHMCWHIEDTGETVVSDRLVKGVQWKDQIDQLAVDKHHVPGLIEVVFDNLCNLNCSYCDPGQSSSWAAKVQKQPIELASDYRELYRKIHIQSGETKQDYLDAWLAWWPEIRNQVKTLKISGGEPLISPNFWKFFDILGHSPQLKFSINSNLCVDPRRIEAFAKKAGDFKSIKISASIDGQGSKAEYVRKGLDYELFLNNAKLWCDITPDNCTLSLQSTVNILSVWSFADFIELVAVLRKQYPNKIVTFYSTMVRFPEFQSMGLLPRDLRLQLAQDITDKRNQYLDLYDATELVYIEKITGYLLSDPEPLVKLDADVMHQDLVKFLDRYDQFDGYRVHEVFPESFIAWLDKHNYIK